MEKIDITRCRKKKKAILKEYKNLPEEKNKKIEYRKIYIARCLKKKKQN